MKRYESGSARYITASCYKRMQLMGSPAIRDAFAAQLEELRKKWGFKLRAWVAMPEHFHMILWPGARHKNETPDMAPILHDFKGTFGRYVIGRWRVMNAPILSQIAGPRGRPVFWQRGGGFDRNIRTEEEMAREITYIHQNPVKRGLVTSPTDWAWSSARWYAGMTDGVVTIDPVWWLKPRDVGPSMSPQEQGDE
jgi:putative transposase